MTSDRDRIQPRLAAKYPQLRLGVYNQADHEYPSVFINSNDHICSMKWTEISISLEGQQKDACQEDQICTACSTLSRLVWARQPVKKLTGWALGYKGLQQPW